MDIRSTVLKIGLIERELGVRRTAILVLTAYLTLHSYTWSIEYAKLVLQQGQLTNDVAAGAAAIIFAVTAPVSWLMKVVFSSYISSKGLAAVDQSNPQQ